MDPRRPERAPGHAEPVRLVGLAVVLACVTMAACGDEANESSKPTLHPLCDARPDLCVDRVGTDPSFTDPVVVLPSASMPDGIDSQRAHNNLDAAWFDGRVFLAFRTAPNHFASADTVLFVVSTPDLESWRFEGRFEIGTDIREPQLGANGEQLVLYFAELGDNPLDFEPHGVWRALYSGPGQWTEPEAAFDPGFVIWRTHRRGDGFDLLGYTGGEQIYDDGGAGGLEVHWLASDDGVSWDPAIGDDPVVLRGGGSETDLAFLPDGGIVAVSRNEAGDETGFGSHICRAEPEDLGAWECRSDVRKFDSPLVFRDASGVWLIGRRNLTESGAYDLELADLPSNERSLRYQLDYWTRPKRCSVWRVSPTTLSVDLALDLPSRGDTCFPEAIDLGGGRHLVFNYTSPLDGDDVSWQVGQGGDTWIYWVILHLPIAEPR